MASQDALGRPFPPRSIENIARDAAQHTIRLANRSGLAIKKERTLFQYSDVLDLEAEIIHWLESHIEQEKQHAIDTAPARVPVETAPETASGEAGVETVLGPETVVGVRAHGTSMKQRR